jgi:competence protein ComEA
MQFKSPSLGKFVTTLAAMLLLAPFVVRAEPVNINTADASTLAKSLNGVGPAKARAIVSYREKNGPFKSVDQLAMVEGTSQKLIDRNRADLRLGADKAAPDKVAADKPAGAPAAPAPTGKTAKPAS